MCLAQAQYWFKGDKSLARVILFSVGPFFSSDQRKKLSWRSHQTLNFVFKNINVDIKKSKWKNHCLNQCEWLGRKLNLSLFEAEASKARQRAQVKPRLSGSNLKWLDTIKTLSNILDFLKWFCCHPSISGLGGVSFALFVKTYSKVLNVFEEASYQQCHHDYKDEYDQDEDHARWRFLILFDKGTKQPWVWIPPSFCLLSSVSLKQVPHRGTASLII